MMLLKFPWVHTQMFVDVAGENTVIPTGINAIKTAEKDNNGAIYNLAGQKVENGYKGLVIKNGKKMIQK